MPYIGNVSAFDSVDTEQIKDGAVTPDKVSSGIATTVGFESTGIDDNATAVKLTVADTGIDVTGTVTADGLGIGTSAPTAKLHFGDGADNSATQKETELVVTSTDGSWQSAGAGIKAVRTWLSTSWLQFMVSNGGNRAPAMTIDSSGNVGIGTDSPESALHVAGAAENGQAAKGVHLGMYNSSYGMMEMVSAAGVDSWIDFKDTDDTDYSERIRGGAGNLQLHTVGSERMRIDSSGNVWVGTTTSGIGNGRLTTFNDGTNYATVLANTSATTASKEVLRMYHGKAASTTAATQIRFLNSTVATVGTITSTGTTTSYGVSSDYRLKTNVLPMTGATATFKQLKPVNFEWIADGTRVDGFLAHELQEVIPAAATGSKDAMRDEEYEVSQAVEATYDNEGEELTASEEAVMATRSVPDMQGIDQSKVVPLLVATVQELIARIEALEGN